MSIDKHDKKTIRCRMLGHEVPFGYCRCGVGELPCRKIFDCWHEHFGVTAFMQEYYSPEAIRQMLEPPKDKTVSLFELIQKAKKNV